MFFIKKLNLFNTLLALFTLINIISYATGRLQLFPLLVVGTLQILLGAIVHTVSYKLKNLDENE